MRKFCQNCQQSVSSSSYYCSNCGAPLIDSPIIVPHDQNISVTGHTVTSRQLKQMGVSVAVSVLALLAEVSLIYLQRRLDRYRQTAVSIIPAKRNSLRTKQDEIVTSETREVHGEVVTVARERVVEIRRWGRPMQRVIDRMVWRREPKN